MTPLFISAVCDYCDGKKSDAGRYDRGWVVWRGNAFPSQEYVFATRENAERWRALQSLEECPIREVLAPVRFRWRESNGTVKGLKMADQLVMIYENAFFPPLPNRAFIVEDNANAA